MPCVKSGWVGPSPRPAGTTTSHRTFGRTPANESSKFVLGDNVNTLPGGSHSEQESDNGRQRSEDIRKEEKPAVVRKRRRCARLCLPGKRKKKIDIAVQHNGEY